MGKPIPISIGKGSASGRSGQEGMSDYINGFIQDLGESGKVSFTARAINGCELFASVSANGFSVLRRIGNVILGLNGTNLSNIALDGSSAFTVGGIPGTGFATAAMNRRAPDPHVAFVRDGACFIYQNGVLTQLSDPDLPPPICVVELLGYFIFPTTDGRFFITDTNDITVDALDFAEAESSSDKNVMAATRGRTFILFGELTTEMWDITGQTFPLGYTAGLAMGCYAAGSVQNLIVEQNGRSADTVIWAATDRNGAYSGIKMLDGYTPVNISKPQVDRAILAEPDKSSIRSMAWTEDAHPLYCISGSSFSHTYDGKTQQWHRRRTHNLPRWYASCYVQVGEKTIFGHYSDGKLYESRGDLLDEAGLPIVWTVQPPTVSTWPKKHIMQHLHVDMVTGVGVNSTNEMDADPNLYIRYSKDGGASWSGTRVAKLGRTGQIMRRIVESGFGRVEEQGIIFQLTCSARVFKTLQQMAVEIKVLG